MYRHIGVFIYLLIINVNVVGVRCSHSHQFFVQEVGAGRVLFWRRSIAASIAWNPKVTLSIVHPVAMLLEKDAKFRMMDGENGVGAGQRRHMAVCHPQWRRAQLSPFATVDVMNWAELAEHAGFEKSTAYEDKHK